MRFSEKDYIYYFEFKEYNYQKYINVVKFIDIRLDISEYDYHCQGLIITNIKERIKTKLFKINIIPKTKLKMNLIIFILKL